MTSVLLSSDFITAGGVVVLGSNANAYATLDTADSVSYDTGYTTEMIAGQYRKYQFEFRCNYMYDSDSTNLWVFAQTKLGSDTNTNYNPWINVCSTLFADTSEVWFSLTSADADTSGIAGRLGDRFRTMWIATDSSNLSSGRMVPISYTVKMKVMR